MNPRSSRSQRLAGALSRRDAHCPECGYNLRGLRSGRCPECGRDVEWSDMPGDERPMGWRVHLVDLTGVGTVVGINALLLALTAWAVIGQNRASWFTSPRFQVGRRPETIATLTLYLLAVSLIAWGLAWEYGSWESWRWQVAAAAWCAVLTVFHAAGVASLWV